MLLESPSIGALGLGTESSLFIFTAAALKLGIAGFLPSPPLLRGRTEGRPPECACGGGRGASAVGEWNGGDLWAAKARMAMGERDPVGDCCARRAGHMHRQRAGAQKTCGSCCC